MLTLIPKKSNSFNNQYSSNHLLNYSAN
uniref:Uncharacterized protein n=1 Tax=Tetranychus urticae TaxID=32264 RepID=T1JYZ0_TETUR